MNVATRAAGPADLDAIAQIQANSPGAAQWKVADYLAHQCFVALAGEQVAGFIVFRETAPDQAEILNLAVDPKFRRRGIARCLVALAIAAPRTVFLEVRESNAVARKLYEGAGFRVITFRESYYNDTHESAIVMKFHS